MIKFNSAEAKKNFKEWVKDFLAYHVSIPVDDVWTLDLIAETITMKYEKDMNFILENR